MTTIVLFGATGFIGQHLTAAAAAAGHHVIAVSRSGRKVAGAASSFAIKALADIPALPADTVIFHVAAQRYDAYRFDMAQSDILTANVELTDQVYAFCAVRGVKEVRLASSVAVYEAGLPLMDDCVPIDLNKTPNRNEAFYAWSKRWAEVVASLFAERYGVSTVAFRLSNPYGPFDSIDPKAAHVLPAFVIRALSPGDEFALRGDPLVERDFIWAGDVARVFLQSLDWCGRSETYNLCVGKTVTLEHLAGRIVSLSQSAKRITTETGFAPAAVRARVSSADRLKAAFGIEVFTPLDEGLMHTIEWYRKALQHA